MVVLAFTTNFQYFHDLFYLTPYFAASFPLLQELIVLDLDLEFRYLINYSDTYRVFLAVQDSSIGDLVTQSVSE